MKRPATVLAVLCASLLFIPLAPGCAQDTTEPRVTLSLHEAGVEQALTRLFEGTGLHYRLAVKTLSGTVTINAVGVPLHIALRQILRQAQPTLRFRVEDGVYQIETEAAPAGPAESAQAEAAGSWRLRVVPPARARIDRSDAGPEVTVLSTSSRPADVELSLEGLRVAAGHTYTLSFEARASGPHQAVLLARGSSFTRKPDVPLLAERFVQSWRPCVFRFAIPPGLSPDASVVFTLGSDTGTVSIRKVALREGEPGLDQLAKSVAPGQGEAGWAEIPWRHELGRARKEAQEQKKPLLVWLSSEPPTGPC